MPAPSPVLDEHGFPIPPTFDAPRPGAQAGSKFRRVWRAGLIAAFVATLAAVAFRSSLLGSAKEMIAERLVNRAREKAAFEDLSGALADLDRAVSWAPAHAGAYEQRAEVRLALSDACEDPAQRKALVGLALDDYNTLIRLSPRYAMGYVARGGAWQRLRRFPEAIDDLTQAIALSPQRWPTPRNNRAYFRALANIDLDEALKDIQVALRAFDEWAAEVKLQSSRDQFVAVEKKIDSDRATLLDTRGYIYFRQDNLSEALKDLTNAINATKAWADYVREAGAQKPSVQAAFQRHTNHNLAVMYHHRGEVLEKLGDSNAKADLDLSLQLGYNPDQGVF
jgi:tetratricopeptide (TPR) repeat protein